MFFVVEKLRLQRLIAITRDDRRASQQGKGGPFFRIEARDGKLKLSGREVEAEFPVAVYAEGVLFLRVTLFRRALAALTDMPTVAIQVSRDGVHVGDVTLPLEPNNMLLYTDPSRAPARHPDEESGAPQRDGQGLLFLDDRENSNGENSNGSGVGRESISREQL